MEYHLLDGKEIANNIRAERNRARLSQEEVAEKLGITTRTYISYEKDARAIGATMIYKMSLIFECNVSAFFVQ